MANRNIPTYSPLAGPVTAGGESEQAASVLFDQFCAANTFQAVMNAFHGMCDVLEMRPVPHQLFYKQLKLKLNTWKAQSLWSKLDKRAAHREYRKGTACPSTQALIIGCGPCGLRTAIEIAFLGGQAVIIEKRDRLSRNNVLHLWPFLIHDLKALGAKKFFGKFCAGSIDHISIRTLQCILIKTALLVGVEIHAGVSFEGVVEPEEGFGWRAKVAPADHPVSQYEFDVLIGADGKRNTLTGFRRKEFRGKLAIAITANFINRNTQAEASVEEISGVAFIFNQKFFKDLNYQTGIDLENIVYYKDETHYFVMTAKKHSLLDKKVLIQDFDSTEQLLSSSNVDQTRLEEYAKQAADFSTKLQLPSLDFAHNQYGQPDVSMFDFTSIYAAEHASRVVERKHRKLLVGLVGDSLLEPFWPTGSGCARGFFGAFDAAWMIRAWASAKKTPLEVMAERESIYQLLSQTTPENISKNYHTYTIDPFSRYPNLHSHSFKPHQMKNQYDGEDMAYLHQIVEVSVQNSSQYDLMRDSQHLLKWFQRQLEPYRNIIRVMDLTRSWRSGVALCCLIHRYRPELLPVDVYSLDPNLVEDNNQMAFDIAEKELGITAVMTGQEMGYMDIPDKMAMLAYLSQFYTLFRKESIEPEASKHRQETQEAGEEFHSRIMRRLRNKCEEFEYTEDKEKKYEREALKKKRKPLYTYGNTKRRIKQLSAEKKKEMREKTRQFYEDDDLDTFRGGVGRVGVLAKDLAVKFSGKEKPKQSRLQPKTLIVGLSQQAEFCYFCKEPVYLMERYTAEGLFFHQSCFQCHYCGINLRLATYSMEREQDGTAKFFCGQHHGLTQKERRPPRRQAEKHPLASKFETPPTGRPSERIEYITESELEESEYEQTAHNLSGSMLDLDDESDTDTSSDDDEVFKGDLSDGETSWAQLALENKPKKVKSTFGRARPDYLSDEDESETETETGGSDADYETETETEREDELPKRKKPTDLGASLLRPPPTVAPTKPSPTSQEVMKNRMSFFTAPAEPVRIDSFAFLGLKKSPATETSDSKVGEESKAEESKEDSKEGGEAKTEEETTTDESQSTPSSRRRRSQRHLVGDVSIEIAASMYDAASLVNLVDESASSEEEDDDDEDEDYVTDSDEFMAEEVEANFMYDADSAKTEDQPQYVDLNTFEHPPESESSDSVVPKTDLTTMDPGTESVETISSDVASGTTVTQDKQTISLQEADKSDIPDSKSLAFTPETSSELTHDRDLSIQSQKVPAEATEAMETVPQSPTARQPRSVLRKRVSPRDLMVSKANIIREPPKVISVPPPKSLPQAPPKEPSIKPPSEPPASPTTIPPAPPQETPIKTPTEPPASPTTEPQAPSTEPPAPPVTGPPSEDHVQPPDTSLTDQSSIPFVTPAKDLQLVTEREHTPSMDEMESLIRENTQGEVVLSPEILITGSDTEEPSSVVPMELDAAEPIPSVDVSYQDRDNSVVDMSDVAAPGEEYLQSSSTPLKEDHKIVSPLSADVESQLIDAQEEQAAGEEDIQSDTRQAPTLDMSRGASPSTEDIEEMLATNKKTFREGSVEAQYTVDLCEMAGDDGTTTAQKLIAEAIADDVDTVEPTQSNQDIEMKPAEEMENMEDFMLPSDMIEVTNEGTEVVQDKEMCAAIPVQTSSRITGDMEVDGGHDSSPDVGNSIQDSIAEDIVYKPSEGPLLTQPDVPMDSKDDTIEVTEEMGVGQLAVESILKDQEVAAPQVLVDTDVNGKIKVGDSRLLETDVEPEISIVEEESYHTCPGSLQMSQMEADDSALMVDYSNDEIFRFAESIVAESIRDALKAAEEVCIDGQHYDLLPLAVKEAMVEDREPELLPCDIANETKDIVENRDSDALAADPDTTTKDVTDNSYIVNIAETLVGKSLTEGVKEAAEQIEKQQEPTLPSKMEECTRGDIDKGSSESINKGTSESVQEGDKPSSSSPSSGSNDPDMVYSSGPVKTDQIESPNGPQSPPKATIDEFDDLGSLSNATSLSSVRRDSAEMAALDSEQTEKSLVEPAEEDNVLDESFNTCYSSLQASRRDSEVDISAESEMIAGVISKKTEELNTEYAEPSAVPAKIVETEEAIESEKWEQSEQEAGLPSAIITEGQIAEPDGGEKTAEHAMDIIEDESTHYETGRETKAETSPSVEVRGPAHDQDKPKDTLSVSSEGDLLDADSITTASNEDTLKADGNDVKSPQGYATGDSLDGSDLENGVVMNKEAVLSSKEKTELSDTHTEATNDQEAREFKEHSEPVNEDGGESEKSKESNDITDSPDNNGVTVQVSEQHDVKETVSPVPGTDKDSVSAVLVADPSPGEETEAKDEQNKQDAVQEISPLTSPSQTEVILNLSDVKRQVSIKVEEILDDVDDEDSPTPPAETLAESKQEEKEEDLDTFCQLPGKSEEYSKEKSLLRRLERLVGDGKRDTANRMSCPNMATEYSMTLEAQLKDKPSKADAVCSDVQENVSKSASAEDLTCILSESDAKEAINGTLTREADITGSPSGSGLKIGVNGTLTRAMDEDSKAKGTVLADLTNMQSEPGKKPVEEVEETKPAVRKPSSVLRQRVTARDVITAKRKFFCEPPRPVQINPKDIFQDIPMVDRKREAGKKYGWSQSMDAAVSVSPTTALPKSNSASGDAEFSLLAAQMPRQDHTKVVNGIPEPKVELKVDTKAQKSGSSSASPNQSLSLSSDTASNPSPVVLRRDQKSSERVPEEKLGTLERKQVETQKRKSFLAKILTSKKRDSKEDKDKAAEKERRKSSEKKKKESNALRKRQLSEEKRLEKERASIPVGYILREVGPMGAYLKRPYMVRARGKPLSIQERIEAVAPAPPPFRQATPPRATIEELEGESDTVSLSSSKTATEKEMLRERRKQRQMLERQRKAEERKRLRKAQEIQRLMEEVGQKQKMVEQRGVAIEKQLRQNASRGVPEEATLMEQWFNLVHEKNVLARYESELMIRARELELQDRHSRLEQQLRRIVAVEPPGRTTEQDQEEQKILKELVEVVEQRDALVALLEEDRIREREVDRELQQVMARIGYQLSPIMYLKSLSLSSVNIDPMDLDV